MKITLAELYVLTDALNGSCKFYERPELGTWVFDRKTRLDTMNSILAKMGTIEVEVTAPEGGEAKKP